MKKRKDDNWPKRLDAAVKRKFNVTVETFYDLFGTMRYVTIMKDRRTQLPQDVHAFILKWMETRS